eukprot:g32658.t1
MCCGAFGWERGSDSEFEFFEMQTMCRDYGFELAPCIRDESTTYSTSLPPGEVYRPEEYVSIECERCRVSSWTSTHRCFSFRESLQSCSHEAKKTLAFGFTLEDMDPNCMDGTGAMIERAVAP